MYQLIFCSNYQKFRHNQFFMNTLASVRTPLNFNNVPKTEQTIIVFKSFSVFPN